MRDFDPFNFLIEIVSKTRYKKCYLISKHLTCRPKEQPVSTVSFANTQQSSNNAADLLFRLKIEYRHFSIMSVDQFETAHPFGGRTHPSLMHVADLHDEPQAWLDWKEANNNR